MAIADVDNRLTNHEQICAERYLMLERRMTSVETRLDGVDARIKRLESVMMRVAGVLLVGMGGVISTILLKVG